MVFWGGVRFSSFGAQGFWRMFGRFGGVGGGGVGAWVGRGWGERRLRFQVRSGGCRLLARSDVDGLGRDSG